MTTPRSHALRNALASAADDGGITLVIGAGVSRPFRVPTWFDLVDRLWRQTFGNAPPPEVGTLPNALPLALEHIDRCGEPGRFASRLRRGLYEHVVAPTASVLRNSNDSLAVIARLLVREHRAGPRRRIVRVISFNADDLLERAVSALAPRQFVLKLIARASHHPHRARGAQAIPVYHLHGFVPQNPRAHWHRSAPDSLVFTDGQYWNSVAVPLSFANRTMSFALHDSRCVFVGTSMTDTNLLRWLATHADEVARARARELAMAPHRSRQRAERAAGPTSVPIRHFWIRPPPQGDRFIVECMQHRGVGCIEIPDWNGSGFRDLIAETFP